ncbi:sulfatase [Lentisphaera marina]|uniref:sulfatase n=1 Tax=Lentisphaera marina TaxID=1111041 RepID=UPI00236574CA|nr:sulfatase [Lentisphaera marina]MDD7987355.1 sulfatase [Lentisphaera marina]
MKNFIISLVLFSFGLQAKSPNFIMIYLDDLGWADTAVEMIPGDTGSRSDFYQTPNIVRLAEGGMVFSSAYAPSPVCTPSRNSVQHGMTPARMLNAVLHSEAASKEYRGVITIPQALKKANPNYISAHFGKWHIPSLSPRKAGYEITDGPTGNGEGDYMDDFKTHLPEDDPKRMVSLTDKTIKFIEDQNKVGKPFFVQLSHYAVHIWHDSFAETREKYKKIARSNRAEAHDYFPDSEITESMYKHNWIVNYAAMVDDMDAQFGRVLDRLDELGIADNTYVIITGDNGGGMRNNGRLSGSKGDLTEGGIRVPFIVRGPKVRANSYTSVPTAGWDILATFYDLAGGTDALPPEVEGGSLKNVLAKGDKASVERNLRDFVFYFPWYNGEPESALISGKFKILKNLDTKDVQLFDLSKDVSEGNNIAKQMPEKTIEMEKTLDTYITKVKAEDLMDLRIGYLDRMTKLWIPNTDREIIENKKLMDQGDARGKKEYQRLTGYRKWMEGEIKFTVERAKMHGHDLSHYLSK